MSEDNLELATHIKYNMPEFSTYRKRISPFLIEDFLQRGPDLENMKETSAKNVLMEIGDREANLGVRMRESRLGFM